MSNIGFVQSQRVYWAQVQAAGAAFDFQAGPAALTVANAASVYTITMPANFTVPINRRMIVLTSRGSAALVPEITYDEAGSAANTVVVRTFAAAVGAVTAVANVAFLIEIWRVQSVIGAGVG